MESQLDGRLSLPVALGLAALVTLALVTVPAFRESLKPAEPESASAPEAGGTLEGIEDQAPATAARESVAAESERDEAVTPSGSEESPVSPGRTVLTVTAHDQSTDQDLKGFTVLVRGEGIGTSSRPASGGVMRISYDLEREITAQVRLIRPEPPMPVSTEVTLRPYENATVRLIVPRVGELIVGQVVDERGVGIDDALVFVGDEASGRHEPFAPFREDWVMGVRSGAGGWFELTGEGPFVTAVHENFSSATVPSGENVRLTPHAPIWHSGAARGRRRATDTRRLCLPRR